MLRKVLVRLGLVSVIGTGIALAVACGTDAVGIETCRQIESARCRQAPNCPNISLAQPLHPGPGTRDVDACVRFYNDACQHGLEVGDPGAPVVKLCVDAINRGDCKIVEKPESDPACAWLIPPAPPPADAAADVTGDAPVEAAAD